MEREIINFSDIPNYKDLFFDEAIFDEEGDECLYEVVKSEIYYYNLEKSYLNRDIVFVRNSDGKYFKCLFTESPWRNTFPETASEVFPEVIRVTDTIFK